MTTHLLIVVELNYFNSRTCNIHPEVQVHNTRNADSRLLVGTAAASLFASLRRDLHMN